MDFLKIMFRGDRIIWFIFISLCALSLVEVYSATSTLAYKEPNYWLPILRHSKHLLLGLLAIIFVHHLHYRWLGGLVFLFFIAAIVLALTPYIGTSINNELRWVSFFGILFQPSELAKLGSIGFIAFLMSRIGQTFTEKHVYWIIVICMTPVLFLILIYNASTALILAAVVFSMMMMGQIPWSRLLKTGACALAVVGLYGTFLCLAPIDLLEKVPPSRDLTWRSRILSFGSDAEKSEEEKKEGIVLTDKNYQKIHAKIAIAKGGMTPRMPGHGTQRDFLPQAYSDFIYAIIIEELGLFAGIITIFAYVAILIRVRKIAQGCKNRLFPKYLVLGCGLLLVLQAFINMAVATDFFPVTGQPLPLVSTGGTSTILSCTYIGIILCISRITEDEKKADETQVETLDPSVINIEEEA